MKTKSPLIECKGAQFGNLAIPSFELYEGDFAILHIYNGAHYWDTMHPIAEILSGKKQHKRFTVHRPLKWVEHIRQGKWGRTFFPLTVERYFKAKGLKDFKISQDFFRDDRVKAKTKISHLPGNPRKKVSLLATLHHSNKIVFDLAGLDPKGAREVFEIVKQEVDKGGVAVLIDGFDDFKNEDVKFIKTSIIP